MAQDEQSASQQEQLDPGYPFVLHTIEGPLSRIDADLDELLSDVTRMWSQRRFLAIIFALFALAVAIWMLAINQVLIFLLVLLAGGSFISIGNRSGRHIEVEVETITLCRQLIALTEEHLSSTAHILVEIDLRSAFDESKGLQFELEDDTSEATLGPGQESDHWFTLQLPLGGGQGLELELRESVVKNGYALSGKRLGRDYRTALYRNHEARPEDLIEAVTSHLSTPSATTITGRVREGHDAFKAAIDQLIGEHVLKLHEQIEAVQITHPDPEELPKPEVSKRASIIHRVKPPPPRG